MFHVVLITIIVVESVLGWLLVNSSPRTISMILPRGLSFALGTFFLVLGFFLAFCGAFALGDSAVIVGCLIQSFVGLFFIFAGSAGMRGDVFYDQVTRRVGIMLGLLIGVIVADFYLPSAHFVAFLNLGLITAGAILTADLRQSLRR